MLYICKFLEQKETKLYNVLPIKNNIIPSHFMLDTETIIRVFIDQDKHGKLNSFVKDGNIVKRKQEIWSFFFKTDLKCFVFQNKGTFHGMIKTDGISCSLIFKKHKKTKKSEEIYIEKIKNKELKDFQDKKIIGIDPNHSNLIYCQNSEEKTFRYTQNQRRFESGTKRN